MNLSNPTHRSSLPDFSVAAVTSICITCAWFWLTWRWGFDLADEGFFWYGAQRTSSGEVPLLDFMSYDIGRYYWATFFMQLLGNDGPFAARLGAAVFKYFGTFLGVFICLSGMRRQGVVRWLFALLVACVLTIWAKPYYKVFDHTSSILIVGMLVLMLRYQKPSRWLLAGICLGVVAMIGRNHGFYGVVTSMAIAFILIFNGSFLKTIFGLYGYFILGVFISYSPTLIMTFTVDGFAAAFLKSIFSLFNRGSTNILLPVPWPWTVKLDTTNILLIVQNLSIGIGFLSLLLFPIIGTFLLLSNKLTLSNDARKVFVAIVVASIPYAHYSFSRADVTHLSFGMFPLLIGLMVLGGSARGLRPLVLVVGLLVVSVLTVPPAVLHRIVQKNWVETDVAGEQLWVSPELSKTLLAINNILLEQPSSFLALPNMPSIHAIFRQKMATWEIYALFQRNEDFEAREIERLELALPKIILLSDHALDGNPAFRFSRSHPVTYQWVTSNYKPVSSIENSDITVFAFKQ